TIPQVTKFCPVNLSAELIGRSIFFLNQKAGKEDPESEWGSEVGSSDPVNADGEGLTVAWSEAETQQLLKQAHRAYNTEVNDLLLTALGLAIHSWTGAERVLVNLEGHGREAILPEVDITRTVGWFTSLYPVLLETGKGMTLATQ
ncbi:hypothetical protein E4V51_33510, partial [Paenibacillus sp. 28ISP30-2]|nr:hypothetical protein [Paenibacillus sp. 28ISP30-2]